MNKLTLTILFDITVIYPIICCEIVEIWTALTANRTLSKLSSFYVLTIIDAVRNIEEDSDIAMLYRFILITLSSSS